MEHEKTPVLVHLASGIGNIVLATPLIAALEELGFPVELWLHADYPQTADLLSNWSAIRKIYSRSDAPLRNRNFQVVIPAIPPFYWPKFHRLYGHLTHVLQRPPDSLFYQNEQEYYLTFARRLGFPSTKTPVCRLPIAPSGLPGIGKSTVIIAPGCKTGEMAAKRWPFFPELASRFDDVALVGTPDDLRSSAGAPIVFPEHVRSFVDQLSLRQTAELMASAGAVVGNDSGLSHIAGAVGVPTLILFGPTPHLTLGSLPPNVTVLRSGLPCEPCWFGARFRECRNRIDCLNQLSIDKVESHLRSLLQLDSSETAEIPSLSPQEVMGEMTPAIDVRIASVTSSSLESESERNSEIATVVRDSLSLSSPRAPVAQEVPLASCIMPTCGRLSFVPQAIQYFLRQDYANKELIILDDGFESAAGLIPDDPRIRYQRLEKKRSVGAKRNLACELARGEIVVHWDDDDWMADWRLSYQVQALLGNPRHGACGLMRLFFFDPQSRLAWEYAYNRERPAWLAGGTLCYWKRLWLRNRFADICEGEDTKFVWSLPTANWLPLENNNFYAALVHAGNTSQKRVHESQWRRYSFGEITRLLAKDWPFYQEVADSLPPLPNVQPPLQTRSRRFTLRFTRRRVR
jgi:ADP-heptose:LPS heptosyltransferase